MIAISLDLKGKEKTIQHSIEIIRTSSRPAVLDLKLAAFIITGIIAAPIQPYSVRIRTNEKTTN